VPFGADAPKLSDLKRYATQPVQSSEVVDATYSGFEISMHHMLALIAQMNP
jgi:hypothetical protein